MAAPKGNAFWKQVCSKTGRKLIFATPKALKDAALEYFKSVDENPLYEQKPHVVNGVIEYSETEKKRPYTISGMCVFFRITTKTYYAYRRKKDFIPIIGIIESIIYSQKFEGAAAGLFNTNIIARDLGLKDHTVQEVEHYTYDETPEEEMKRRGIPVPSVAIDDLEADE